jgi:hypothetical protein
MTRIRISLRALILAMTAAALLMGYSQWHRQTVLARCEEFYLAGVDLNAPAEWRDRLWQRLPDRATIYEERFLTIERLVDKRALEEQSLRELATELKKLGVNRIIVKRQAPDHLLFEWNSRQERARRNIHDQNPLDE